MSGHCNLLAKEMNEMQYIIKVGFRLTLPSAHNKIVPITKHAFTIMVSSMELADIQKEDAVLLA